MAYFRCGGGSGGVELPTFTSTTLYDSNGDYSSVATISIPENYHNFDFLKFTIYRDITGTPTYAGEFIISPTAIDEIYTTRGLYISFFPLYNPTNYGLCISPTGNTTFTRRWYREVSISKIEGLTCTNKTVTASILYSASASATTFATSADVRNYDFLTVQSYGSVDESGFSLIRMDNIFNDDEVIIHAPTYSMNNRATAMAGSIDGINFYKYYGNGIAVIVGYKFT